jgi:hypothetical protein
VATVGGDELSNNSNLAVIQTASKKSQTLFHQEGKGVMATQWSPRPVCN